MSKEPSSVKKVIKTEIKKTELPIGAASSLNVKKRTSSGNDLTNTPVEMTFDKKNIQLLLISVGLVFLGYLLMLGGKMPSNDVWDEKIIYSFTRTVLSPLVILSGLGLSIYAIFKPKQQQV